MDRYLKKKSCDKFAPLLTTVRLARTVFIAYRIGGTGAARWLGGYHQPQHQAAALGSKSTNPHRRETIAP
jgi:hypothetical protein